MLNMNIKQIEELGVADYYFDISKFIHNFINKNYPLTEFDMISMTNGKTTANIQYRKKVLELLSNELSIFLTQKIEENKNFIEKLNKGINVKAQTIDEYKKEIFEFEQLLLEVLWNYNSKNNHIK